MSISNKIAEAWERRQSLHESQSQDCYRIFHGYSEGIGGLEIDRYGDVAVIQSKGADSSIFPELADALASCFDFRAIVAKERGQASELLSGAMPKEAHEVQEFGLRYLVEAWAPRNPGLYLDARSARAWLREGGLSKEGASLLEGGRILNLFSFTGSLGVAARAGGANSVTHVDTQKRALTRAQENHRLNGQAFDGRDLQKKDVPKFLQEAYKKGRRFRGVIADPPPFRAGSRSESRKLSTLGLAKKISGVLEEQGWVLCFFHHDPRSWDELEAEFAEASGASWTCQWRGQSGEDFPEEREETRLRLSVLQKKD